jgi:phage anti-repressor protein
MEGLKIIESGLVSVYEDKEARTVVNAREMHDFVESGQDFSDWIKSRVEKYKFLEGEDFSIILWKSTGGRPAKEYLLSIDMAKEIAMVENNDKGRQVRKYFIECERRLRASRGLIGAKDAEKMRQRAKYLEILDRNARSRQAQILKFVVEFFRDILSDASMQAIASEMTVLATGFRLVELPESSAAETEETCGAIASMVARIAGEFGLKTEEYRKFVLSKKPSA